MDQGNAAKEDFEEYARNPVSMFEKEAERRMRLYLKEEMENRAHTVK
jgi:hypothetical protein